MTVAIAGLLAGCGSGGSSPAPPPPPPANTAVTLVLSSTANDQLSEFDISLQGMSLTSASGKKVSLLSQGRQSEFIHVNGTIEPLVTATIPQDVYTAATVTIGNAGFTCVTLQPGGGLWIDNPADGQTPSADVTVTLPAPIKVSGAATGLALNLLVSQSANYSGCGATSYAITPAFSLSPFAFTSQHATSQDGGVTGLDGQVTALASDASGFQISLPTSTSVHVTVDSATMWQGIADLTALHQGTFVDLDGAIQGDGSIAANRVAVADPSAVDMQRGPLLFASDAVPIVVLFSRQQQGKDARGQSFKFNSATAFRVSGQLSNLQALPFTPSFTAENMVPGQTVYLSSPAFVATGGYNAVANTITLVPQTVNGTVYGSTTSGDFTVYSVSLESYDLFPLLAAQPGQTTLLTTPDDIDVYVDTNTTVLTPSAPAVGDTLRFYGLVFNDHGTLRMDCAQISAGVTTQ